MHTKYQFVSSKVMIRTFVIVVPILLTAPHALAAESFSAA